MVNKVTLLKDLPTVKAGFNFSIRENVMEEYFRYCRFEGCPKGMDQDSYDEMIRCVLEYREFTEWVKIEPDFSAAIQIQCPNCKSVGMFPYSEDELKKVYDCDVTRWYENVGLRCPRCNHKIHTHSVCVKKKVSW